MARPAAGPSPRSSRRAAAALRIGTGRDATAGERRVVRIDGEPVRGQAALGERLGVLWLTPPMDRLFLEGPGGRRRFLDRLVLGLDPAHGSRVAAYEQALRERSRLLRDGPSRPRLADRPRRGHGRTGRGGRGGTPRGRAAARPRLRRGRRPVSARPADARRHGRELARRRCRRWPPKRKFASALAANRQSDAQAGGALIGPHRSDLQVSLAEKGIAAELASTGEQKALLISILLAHARLQRAVRGEPPLLLLDEIAAHLDASRRAALFDALLRLDSQAWLTGTDEALFAPLRREAQFLSVRDGQLAATS